MNSNSYFRNNNSHNPYYSNVQQQQHQFSANQTVNRWYFRGVRIANFLYKVTVTGLVASFVAGTAFAVYLMKTRLDMIKQRKAEALLAKDEAGQVDGSSGSVIGGNGNALITAEALAGRK